MARVLSHEVRILRSPKTGAHAQFIQPSRLVGVHNKFNAYNDMHIDNILGIYIYIYAQARFNNHVVLILHRILVIAPVW